MVAAPEIVACARRYTGVRFRHQGRCRDGLDCLGLLIRVAQDCNVDFAGRPVLELDAVDYGRRPDVSLLLQKLEQHLNAIALMQVETGDVLLLKIDGSPQHLAIVTDYPMPQELGMIHAYAPARQVVEHRYDDYWKERTYRAFRLPQLC